MATVTVEPEMRSRMMTSLCTAACYGTEKLSGEP
jgi:hypothetical protein